MGDIRALFEMALNERATTIEGVIFPSIQKILGDGRINSKNGGKDLRFDLGGEDKQSIKKISNAFKKLKQDVSIEVAAAGDYANGANSGKFTTFIVKFNKDSKLSSLKISAGDTVKLVDNNPPKGSIKSKELTPSSLKLPEDTQMQLNKLNAAVSGVIKKKYSKSNPFMNSFLTELYMLVANHSPSYTNIELTELGPFTENIKYNAEIKEAIDALGATDLNTIGKDFGEILGAALMLNIVNTTDGISFPSGNNPLVDFHIDGYGISSKYKAGAAPTLSNIIKDLKAENFTEDSEVKLYDLFKIVESNSVINGYIKGAEFMQIPSAIKLKELVGNVELEHKALEAFIQDKLNTIGKEEFFNQYDYTKFSPRRNYDNFQRLVGAISLVCYQEKLGFDFITAGNDDKMTMAVFNMQSPSVVNVYKQLDQVPQVSFDLQIDVYERGSYKSQTVIAKSPRIKLN